MKNQFLSVVVILVAATIMSCNRQETVTDPGSDQGPALEKGAPAPTISSISPASAEIGDLLTITGSNFGTKQGSGSWVTFNGLIATVYTSWSRTQIKVVVPSGSPSGTVQVKVNVGTVQSNGVNMTQLPSSPVTIGTQIWMGANLDVATYSNGDPIPQVTDPAAWTSLTTGAWCYYNYDPANGPLYGKLYNWYAVNDPRGLAPTGWHVPTDAEWKTLSMCLGMSQIDADKIGYYGTTEGGKMKEMGTSLWTRTNVGATNSCGFTALPGGFLGAANPGTGYVFGFYSIRALAGWWSSTEFDDDRAWMRGVYYAYSTTLRNNLRKVDAFSVRCIKDN